MAEAKKLPQYLAAVCVCIGAWGTGTAIAWTSNISEDLKNGRLNDLKITNDELGWIGSLMTLGAMCMCFPIGWIADKLGRKPTVLLTIVPFTVGWLMIIFGNNIAIIYVARFLIGVAGGSFCVTAPMYTSEIAQTEIRGTLGTFFQLFITIGILYCGIFGFALHVKLFNWFCLVIPIIFGVLFAFQPETPVYDLRNNKPDKAEKSFNKLRGKDYDHTGEVNIILADIENEKKMVSFKEAMKTKAAKKSTLICFMLMFYQQLSGINAVMFYSQDIFVTAGSTLKDSYCVIILQTIQVIATVVSAWAVDKFGRRILLMISAAAMAFSTGLLGIFFSLKDREVLSESGVRSIGFIPVLSLNVFIIAFSLGFGPIPWLASSEMFSPEIKSICSSAAATFNWFLAFLVTKFYFACAKGLGTDMTFYIFTVISATAVFFVLIIIPETKGKTFAEIQHELGS
ncbi:facilitated trehalose transporter Tret1-like [Diabrotica virgifera virgifera]|uniref:Facilitated trehalose transporter Tret1-like n=1 Tax=Diabrotica virgifera virgifera TaxID=50390 RepID=A0A6P7FFV7_DIAVI|nr:facilitated trehalose transporter Tret1-like [Diabrotica virgifera virgifera]